MYRVGQVSIWRGDTLIVSTKLKEDVIVKFVTRYLSWFNDKETYEVNACDGDGYCFMCLYGTLDVINRYISQRIYINN